MLQKPYFAFAPLLRKSLYLWFALAALLLAPQSQATNVRIQTVLGDIDIELFDSAAPLTVANFLSYVNSGAYIDSFFHRSVPGFIIQGGGYTLTGTNSARKISVLPPVPNEFSSSRSNLRGTISMAKISGNPDSATSEWFINIDDNSANLNNQNGGFTVFGQVVGNSLAIVDAIAQLPVYQASGAFNALPVTKTVGTSGLTLEHFVLVKSVSVIDTASEMAEADRIFNYLEANFPQFLSPANAPSTTFSGFYLRHYPDTGTYIGRANNLIYYLGPLFEGQLTALASVGDALAMASAAGY